MSIVLKDLILLILEVLILQLLDDLLLFGTPLAILQVVHVQLIFQVVNVGVLLDIGAIESLQLCLKSLVFLLELRLHIFDTLQAFIGAFKFNTSSLDGVLEDGLVATQRLNGLLHLLHLASLRVNDVSNAFFNVLLLRVLVQIATDRVQKLQRFVAHSSHLSLSAKHIVQLSTTFSDFSCELTGSLEVVQFRAGVEIHHLGIHFIILIHLGRFHSLVHHLSYLQHFLN